MNEDRRSEISELNEPEQHSGTSSMSKNNTLVGYSADERRMRNLEERNREKEYDDEEEQEQAPEYQEEQSETPQDEEQEQVQEQPSKLDDAKAAAGELLKGKVKEVAGNAGKVVGQAAVSGVKALGSALAPLLANPIFWIVIAVVLIFLLIFVVVFMGAAGSEEENTIGYYDYTCNFNNTLVSVNYCNSDTIEQLYLEDYVIGSMYAYVGDNSYSDDALMALMIVLKTNVLANGNYDSSTMSVATSECDVGYNASVPDDLYSSFSSLYESTSNYLYVSNTYTSTISTLSIADALSFDGDVADAILNSSLEYEEILESIYGSGYMIYSIDDYCVYYTLTDNTSYWWPIGSSVETASGIYGGTPTATTITSYFGTREIEGTTSNHQAIDIAGSCGVDVVIASLSGTVTKVNDTCENNGSYGNTCGGGLGNYVVIEHEDGTVTRYGHMYAGSITVSVGDTVSQGQMIGLLGNSGSVSGATGCHLHFEVQVNGVKVDPLDYVSVDNPRPVTVSTSSITAVSSSGGVQNVCKSLVNSGLSNAAVAGIMVNLAAESGFNTINLENCYETGQCCTVNGGNYGYCVHTEINGYGSDSAYTSAVDSGAYSKNLFINDHAGYGLVQWTSSGRKEGLYNLAKSQNASIGDLGVQLSYMFSELESGYSNVYKYITGNYSASQIALNFCLYYESPASKETTCANRVSSNLNTYLTYVSNGCS